MPNVKLVRFLIQKHQYLIEAMQWTVSLDRLDVNIAIMTLVSFRDEPRVGNLDRTR